jgi:hypothetical protein
MQPNQGGLEAALITVTAPQPEAQPKGSRKEGWAGWLVQDRSKTRSFGII